LLSGKPVRTISPRHRFAPTSKGRVGKRPLGKTASREVWCPPPSNGLTGVLFTLKMQCMKSKKTIVACLKALSHLVIVCALLFLPTSATHAASGMHGDHHVASVSSDQIDMGHAHAADSSDSMHGKSNSASKDGEQDQASGKCCNGICFSVVLDEADGVFVERTATGRYLVLHMQTASLEASGFLRPPQSLI